MRNNINIRILEKFSEGKYSYNDYLKVRQWFSDIHNFPEIRDELKKQWDILITSDYKREENLEHIFEKIHYNILCEEKKVTRKVSLLNLYRQIAAVLLIPVLALSIWFFIKPKPVKEMAQSWVEINAPQGARVEFLLPDSTTGWLNSGSKLKYPVALGKHRKVELIGEAYFNVSHRDNSDFTVSVPDMDICVLGTRFNVSAYIEEDFTDVALAEGKVKIKGKVGVFDYTLEPDQKITFNRENKSLNLKKADAEKSSAWKDGYLIIENEPLGQVLGRLERWYNAEIILQNEKLKGYRFKATFKDEPLEEVLRLISLTTPIKYSIENRNMDKQNIYKRKRVIIRMK